MNAGYSRIRSWLFLLVGMAVIGPCQSALAAPSYVTIAGSLQSEAGCPGDWDPACAQTHLTYDANDDVWQGSFSLPAGSYEYKAALNNDWTENYGLNATAGGSNIPLGLVAPQIVKFYYDDKTHWVTDNRNSTIAVAPGSFQSELGCSNNWDPSCLRSWLEDPDGDGTYTLLTSAIQTGSYEAKIAINESWTENYGAGGTPGGANIAFSASSGSPVCFSYVPATHVLSVTAAGTCPAPAGSSTGGPGPTGQRAAARQRCKKKFPKGPKRKKCLKKARRLPV